MILIAHRGNINGRFESYENEPNYIDLAISKGYDVEVDVWHTSDILYLGHDRPQYGVNFEWFKDRLDKLWVHCKNVEAIVFFRECGHLINYFWHEEDTLTLTSHNHIWVYPGKQPIKNSIAVMPEINNDNIATCNGVCSDYIERYK
tara:strand:+ start:89 stop:526 length:438 start_codon:yes stop_codon:yes gene_type:complete